MFVLNSNWRSTAHRLATFHERDKTTNDQPRHNTVYRIMRLLLRDLGTKRRSHDQTTPLRDNLSFVG